MGMRSFETDFLFNFNAVFFLVARIYLIASHFICWNFVETLTINKQGATFGRHCHVPRLFDQWDSFFPYPANDTLPRRNLTFLPSTSSSLHQRDLRQDYLSPFVFLCPSRTLVSSHRLQARYGGDPPPADGISRCCFRARAHLLARILHRRHLVRLHLPGCPASKKLCQHLHFILVSLPLLLFSNFSMPSQIGPFVSAVRVLKDEPSFLFFYSDRPSFLGRMGSDSSTSPF